MLRTLSRLNKLKIAHFVLRAKRSHDSDFFLMRFCASLARSAFCFLGRLLRVSVTRTFLESKKESRQARFSACGGSIYRLFHLRRSAIPAERFYSIGNHINFNTLIEHSLSYRIKKAYLSNWINKLLRVGLLFTVSSS